MPANGDLNNSLTIFRNFGCYFKGYGWRFWNEVDSAGNTCTFETAKSMTTALRNEKFKRWDLE